MPPDPDKWTRVEQLLAFAVDVLRVLAWQQTKDGSKGRNKPRPIPRPGVEDKATAQYGRDPIPADDFASWWDDQPDIAAA